MEATVARTYLGVADTQVVGIQYYAGIASNREMITFKRQPANEYDRNATQVLNTLVRLSSRLCGPCAHFDVACAS